MESPVKTSSKDILADMDAFQKEIDALMARDEVGRSGVGSSGGLRRTESEGGER